jgi:hypothetical protein
MRRMLLGRQYIEGPALQGREGFFYVWLVPPGYRIEPLSDRGSTRYLIPPTWCICCSAGPLLEVGSPSGTKAWARSVSVPTALLKSSSRRSGLIFIAFGVTTFGYRRGNLSRARHFINEPPDPDLYHLWLTLYYAWPRCAPRRPGGPTQSLSRLGRA